MHPNDGSRFPVNPSGSNNSMAYMEMTLVLAALFLEMDMEFKDPEAEATQGFGARDAFVLVRPTVQRDC